MDSSHPRKAGHAPAIPIVVSHIKEVPGWSEELATVSEAVVKAEEVRAPAPPPCRLFCAQLLEPKRAFTACPFTFRPAAHPSTAAAVHRAHHRGAAAVHSGRSDGAPPRPPPPPTPTRKCLAFGDTTLAA